MNILEEIQNCPVERKELGEVAEVGTGNNNTNEQVENGKYPFYVRSKNIKTINTYLFDEEAIVIPGEGDIGKIFHYVKGKYGLHQRAYRIHITVDNIKTKFIYYYMYANFKSFITKKAVSATVSSIRKPMIEKFPIPIPPLEIQEKIVQTLDKMTEYATELTSELTSRNKQYSYYRDKLLSFEDEVYPVEWKELGEVCDTVTDFTAAGSFASNAKNVKYIQEASFAQLVRTTDLKSGFKGNNFVYVDEHAFNYLYRVNLDQESLVMPNVGNCGEIYYIEPENLPYENNVLGPNALLVRSSKENNRYLFHLFQSGQFQNELAKITSNTGQTKYNKTNLKKIRIPIPPQEIQEKIVQTLDSFDTVCNDLNIGLPKEIKLRQKQYEYWREQLLSFNK